MNDDFDRREMLKRGTFALAGLLAVAGASTRASGAETGATNSAPASPPISDNAQVRKRSDQAPPLTQGPSVPSISKIPADATAPYQRNDPNWDNVIAKLDELANKFGFKKADSLKVFPRIDREFVFAAQESDQSFRYQQVESLLDQAADLLERATRCRREWDDLGARTFALFLELEQYVETDHIHNQETAAGFYTLAYQLSALTQRAEYVNGDGAQLATANLNQLISQYFSLDRMNADSADQQLEAWLSHLATYDAPAVGNLLNFVWGGAQDTAPDFLKNAAFRQSFRNMDTDQLRTAAQLASSQATANASDFRKQAADARANWDVQDIDFRIQRTAVGRHVADLKARAFTEPNGAFNFPEQMVPLQQRFERDFRDALARINAAQEGLNLLYGYKVPLPLQNSSAYFDDCLIWVRNAIAYLVAFSQEDQSYVLPVSIKSLVSQADWKSGLTTGEFKFALDEDYADRFFQSQRHVRLRGVSGFVWGDVHEGLVHIHGGVWRLTLFPPSESFSRQMSGDKVVLPQSKIAPCRLGRVATREYTREADIAGTAAFHNLGPFGNWRLVMSKQSTEGTDLSKLLDIQIDLYITSRYSFT